MKVSDNILRKYASLIVRTGANVQPGQKVTIICEVNQADFALKLMEESYQAGAEKVNIDWTCEGQDRLNYTYAKEETLSRVLPWEEEKMKQRLSDLPVMIYIESEDPDAMAEVNPELISKVMQKRTAVFKPYRNAMDGKYQWVIAAIPSPAWARKCFPECSGEKAMDQLWDAVLKTVRVDETNDPIAEWKAHVDLTDAKSRWLNDQGFASLRYESENGTKFTVELIPGAKWSGAGTTNPVNGVYYIPNMPTEEVFTSPMAGRCEGTVVSTKPLSWNGQLIDHFSITFADGKAVSCRAEKGQELLEKIIHMDETSCMLGEVALVPKESPINRCGFLFSNTLFDENAVCHLALGMGFKEVLPNGEDLTPEEAQKCGINDSLIHVDFMVGSEDLRITGIRPDGSETAIFVNGTWA